MRISDWSSDVCSSDLFGLLKCKLTGEGDRARIAAVRAGAPDVRLIVDANESWHELDIAAEAQALADLGVEMVEQPVFHGREERLEIGRADGRERGGQYG